jgi:hypothetical protein
MVSGSATIEFENGAQYLSTGSAWFGNESIGITTGAQAATIWRWEITPAKMPDDGAIKTAPGVESIPRLSAELCLDPNQEWLMRCDRVDFPINGVALTHVHQGPGIRCCLFGSIEIHAEGNVQTYNPSEPWLELGHEPVLAKTSSVEPTAFVRCFILPQTCKGKPSIRYVNPEDVSKPKSQKYVIFGERYINI